MFHFSVEDAEVVADGVDGVDGVDGADLADGAGE